jgi:hypothetical protein
MKAKSLIVEPEAWGDNALKVNPTNLQKKGTGKKWELERAEMSLSTQRHGTLYRSKEILHSYQEAQRGMETISIDRGSA